MTVYFLCVAAFAVYSHAIASCYLECRKLVRPSPSPVPDCISPCSACTAPYTRERSVKVVRISFAVPHPRFPATSGVKFTQERFYRATSAEPAQALRSRYQNKMALREKSWRRAWKPDLKSQPWKAFSIENDTYQVKAHFREADCSYELCISDMETVWYEKVQDASFKTRAKVCISAHC